MSKKEPIESLSNGKPESQLKDETETEKNVDGEDAMMYDEPESHTRIRAKPELPEDEDLPEEEDDDEEDGDP